MLKEIHEEDKSDYTNNTRRVDELNLHLGHGVGGAASTRTEKPLNSEPSSNKKK